MAFENPLRNLIIPSGAGSDKARIVIGPDIPAPLKTYLWGGIFPPIAAIIYYKANGDYAFQALFDVTDRVVVLYGTVIAGAVIETGIGNPAGFGLISNSSNDKTMFTIAADTVDPGDSAFLPINATDPDDSTFIDVWNPKISFAAGPGWSGSVKIRHVASPPNTFQVYGSLVMGGTKANATVIGNLLDANRRPATAADIPCSNNNVVAGGESPHLNFQPDGRVICYGFTAATVGFANGFYSTDF